MNSLGDMAQLPLLAVSQCFGGTTFDPELDGERLSRQLDAVRDYMLTANWRTLAEIETATGFPQASISARLRDLRKPKFGAYIVERQRRSAGTWEYRVRCADDRKVA